MIFGGLFSAADLHTDGAVLRIDCSRIMNGEPHVNMLRQISKTSTVTE